MSDRLDKLERQLEKHLNTVTALGFPPPDLTPIPGEGDDG